jgi:hypothetical protein
MDSVGCRCFAKAPLQNIERRRMRPCLEISFLKEFGDVVQVGLCLSVSFSFVFLCSVIQHYRKKNSPDEKDEIVVCDSQYRFDKGNIDNGCRNPEFP